MVLSTQYKLNKGEVENILRIIEKHNKEVEGNSQIKSAGVYRVGPFLEKILEKKNAILISEGKFVIVDGNKIPADKDPLINFYAGHLIKEVEDEIINEKNSFTFFLTKTLFNSYLQNEGYLKWEVKSDIIKEEKLFAYSIAKNLVDTYLQDACDLAELKKMKEEKSFISSLAKILVEGYPQNSIYLSKTGSDYLILQEDNSNSFKITLTDQGYLTEKKLKLFEGGSLNEEGDIPHIFRDYDGIVFLGHTFAELQPILRIGIDKTGIATPFCMTVPPQKESPIC